MNKTEEVIEILENERNVLLSKLSSIEMTILTLKQSNSIQSVNGSYTPSNANNSNNPPVVEKIKGYAAFNVRQKAAAILRTEGRFLHMREIIKIAQELEPKTDPVGLAKQISTAIYTMKNLEDSSLVNYSIAGMNTNTFWGSKNWLNEDGTIKKEHMYDEGQVAISKKKAIEI